MYGQIKLSTCSCVRTDLISIFFYKTTRYMYSVQCTCSCISNNTFTYMYNVPPKFCLIGNSIFTFFPIQPIIISEHF